MAYNVEKDFDTVKVVRRDDYKWGVIDSEGNEIVPFGKYGWIDGFEKGLCRVRSHGEITYSKNIVASIVSDNKIIRDKSEIEKQILEDFQNRREAYAYWGIINEKGEEVLPLVYDAVWNFYGKGGIKTKVVKDGIVKEIYFHQLNPALPIPIMKEKQPYQQRHHDYEAHFGEYAGSYAQDVMGYSDDIIDDVFEGDPDAYWNID